MKTVDVNKNIRWLGVKDAGAQSFEAVLPTPWGTTYNSYLISAEKPTLVETVKVNFRDEYVEKLKSLVNPLDIAYVILNHTEADHTGALPWVVEVAPNARVVTSEAAGRQTHQLFHLEKEPLTVGDGDVLDLGDRELRFISAPYLHWPDTMFTYSPADRALFTCDAFGVHFDPKDGIFDDEAGDFADAYRYYFDNIMRPFRDKVLAALNKIEGLDVDVICTGHGPILRSDPRKYLELYRAWSEEDETAEGRPLVAVFYAGGEGNVAQMADQIARGLIAGGTTPVVRDVDDIAPGDAQALLKAAAGVMFGVRASGDLGERTKGILEGLAEESIRGKVAGAFGPYGTSGPAVAEVEVRLRGVGAVLREPTLAVDFAPDEEVFQKCRQFGRAFAGAL
jgi:flavorubredoxin